MLNMKNASIAIFGAFLLCAAPAVASADDQVPLRAAYTSNMTFTSQTTMTLVGEGHATQLGHATNAGSVAVVGAAPCDGGFIAVNDDTLTAANGDSISIEITETVCPVGPGIYSGTGTFVVLGGTGRFAGATGGGDWAGTGDFNVATVTCNLNGTISHPG
jgi:hypothetical protein